MVESGIDICVIEDDADQLELLVNRLRRWNYSVIAAENAAEGLRLIHEQRPSILICDVCLPNMDGIELCSGVRADRTLDGIYIILSSAFDRRERKQKALHAGADEYLRKPYDADELKARIRNGLRLRKLQERLERAALTDGLTGLWNHSQFRERLEREFQRTRRYGGVVSLLMLDLDHFKAINDTYGHEVGNRILKATATHLKATARETDMVARYGGEEFVVICPETSPDEAVKLAERIRRAFSQRVVSLDHPQLVVHASVGVASTEDARVTSMSDLITLCDEALYCSKRHGRDRVTRSDQAAAAPPRTEADVDIIDRLRKEVVALSMRSKDLSLQSIWALIQALEARDGYSAWHSRNVMLYTNWLVAAAGWSRTLRIATNNAAMLHDLGKIGVPDQLLMKPTSLDPEEMALIRQIPQITCKILEPLRVFETEILIIRHLRERFDGTGYPDGLKGGDIPIGSRLVALTEAFDSITCNRAYRAGRSLEEALDIFRQESGRQFDPQFVNLLIEDITANSERWKNQIDSARIEMTNNDNRFALSEKP